jgi:hypothetical protein
VAFRFAMMVVVVVVEEEEKEEEGEEAGKARAINQTAGMAEWVFTPLRI